MIKPSTQTSPENSLIQLRPADLSDIPFIQYLSKRLFNIYGPYDEMVPGWLGLKTTITIIAQAEGVVCGFAMIGDLSSKYDISPSSELLAIGVDLQMQHKGLGEKLINGIEQRALELNIKRLFLHTATENIKARRLFSRNGYRPWEIKKDFYPAGQDAVIMSKEIRPVY